MPKPSGQTAQKKPSKLHTVELDGGEWTEAPRVSQTTEEQRMRSMRAPEFPGLSPRAPKSKKH